MISCESELVMNSENLIWLSKIKLKGSKAIFSILLYSSIDNTNNLGNDEFLLESKQEVSKIRK